jgi:hypothetical protein
MLSAHLSIDYFINNFLWNLTRFTNMIEDNNWFIFWCILIRTITGLSLTNLTLATFAMIVLEMKHKKAIAMVIEHHQSYWKYRQDESCFFEPLFVCIKGKL